MAAKKKPGEKTGATKTSAAERDSDVAPPSRLEEDIILIVRGTVKTAEDQPIRGAIVRAFDRDLRKEQPLGDAETNDRGEYSISYGPAQFASGDVPSAPTPKLIVRAFVSDQQIGDDVSRPQPTRDEVVDFKTSAPVVSEWEKLTTGIMPLLEGQGEGDQALPPWELNDGDLNPIAEETGLEREKIRLWALAFTVGRHAAVVTEPATLTSKASDDRSNVVVADDLSSSRFSMAGFALVFPPNRAHYGSHPPTSCWRRYAPQLRRASSRRTSTQIWTVSAHTLSTSNWTEFCKLQRLVPAPPFATCSPRYRRHSIWISSARSLL